MVVEKPAPPSGSSEPPPRDVLVVVSKLKHYVRHVSGMHTSDDVIAALSDQLRRLCDDAIVRARAAERKTVMARDFKE
jgi:histone H3/H4